MVCHLSMNAKIHTFDAHYLMTGVGHELDEYVTKLEDSDDHDEEENDKNEDCDGDANNDYYHDEPRVNGGGSEENERADMGQRCRHGFRGGGPTQTMEVSQDGGTRYAQRAGKNVLRLRYCRWLVTSRAAIKAAQRARSGEKFFVYCQHSPGGEAVSL
ncbi:hypothetical protein DPMN_038982 [Dreissena polymorpha]|uniref:Uncharacterized protein n=1 Tax=Dreissena polymorpha TaxID=45954 RepID=A0A9D4MGD6_DREPO|nr:hypothetical protein DPMN_038982 [Dreissena polymorpha]